MEFLNRKRTELAIRGTYIYDVRLWFCCCRYTEEVIFVQWLYFITIFVVDIVNLLRFKYNAYFWIVVI